MRHINDDHEQDEESCSVCGARMERCNRGKYKKRILKQDTERFVLCVYVCMCVQLVKPAAGKRKAATPRSEVMEARDLFLRTFLASLPPFASELALFHPPLHDSFFVAWFFSSFSQDAGTFYSFVCFPLAFSTYTETHKHTQTQCVYTLASFASFVNYCRS